MSWGPNACIKTRTGRPDPTSGPGPMNNANSMQGNKVSEGNENDWGRCVNPFRCRRNVVSGPKEKRRLQGPTTRIKRQR